ncbi:MAG: response regulator [Cyanobacteria bacterium P01_C01_bin.118]
MLQFKAEQLGEAILDLQHSDFCGVAYLETLPNTAHTKHPKVLTFLNGELTYCGSALPKPIDISQKLGQHFNLDIIGAALQLAKKKVDDQTSVRQYLELFVRLRIFTWQDIETYVRKQVVLTLEQVLPYAGKLTLNTSNSVDLSYGDTPHGFTWNQLDDDITQRRQVWKSLASAIPSVHAIPYQLLKQSSQITDTWAKQHLSQWVNGQRTLSDIAHQLDMDPLELSHKYLTYVQKDWLTFDQTRYLATINKIQKTIENDINKVVVNPSKGLARPPASYNTKKPDLPLPTVLSVDDSPVVQAMLKRAIGDSYHVLLASNAMDALSILNKEKIELVFLDVTMPDIDGLELCRTIRNINRFRDLPIVMLTAKDGVFNKIRGQIVGSTHYLTKPVDRSKLLEVLEKYVPSKVAI